jgi:DNA-binding MarR family transcriptional regulator
VFKLDDSLGFLMNRSALAMRWALEDRLAKHGLTAPQWAILAGLWEQNAQPLSAVGAIFHFDKPTTTGIVDRLEDKGLVRRVRDLEDRRITRVHLTKAGEKLRRKLPALAVDVNAAAVEGMSAAELKALKHCLQSIWTNLT